MCGLPLHLGSDPRLQGARQIGRIVAFHKGFARAGTVKTVMFGDQGAPDVTAVPLHALHGLKPVVLTGMAERGWARNNPLSDTVGGGAHGREQLSPFPPTAQPTSGESRKREAHKSHGEDCRSKPHGANLLPAGLNATAPAEVEHRRS